MGHASRVNIQQEPRSHYVVEGPPRPSEFLQMKIRCNIEFSLAQPRAAVRLRVSSSQYVSLGEAPITTAIVVVRGKTRRIFSKNSIVVLVDPTTVSFSLSLSKATRRFSRPLDHRCVWEQVFAVSLDKVGGWRADGHDQIGWLLSVEGMKILDEWSI